MAKKEEGIFILGLIIIAAVEFYQGMAKFLTGQFFSQWLKRRRGEKEQRKEKIEREQRDEYNRGLWRAFQCKGTSEN